tara:strand:+ start:62 stop:391 length:330 start_codon:yes stop_codon:yes gene_type:complete
LNKKSLIIILLISYFATLLRFFVNNNLLVSIIGSFVYGFVIARTISKSKKEILLSGFCSCFTSFSGFVYFLYELIIKGYYFKLFFYLNFIIIFNLLIMYSGFLLSRKMN